MTRPAASEWPETGATWKKLMRHPSPRHAQLGRALAVGDGGMGGMVTVDGGFCGAGLALALSLTGEGSVIWAVFDTNSTVRRRGRARGMAGVVRHSMLLLGRSVTICVSLFHQSID